MATYKAVQEEFIANLNGTSLSELAIVFSTLPGSFWLYTEVMVLLQTLEIVPAVGNSNVVVVFLLEFALLVLPMILSFTLTEYTIPMCIYLYFMAALLSFNSWRRASNSMTKFCGKQKMTLLNQPQKPFLSVFRAQMMICTCIAILAVDFKIFPRRFAKTETYGTSIMDIGVGAFVMSSALTSPSARNIAVTKNRKGAFMKLWGLFRPVLPVVILGFARLVTVKGIEYQEHVSEYGVHWNFYFTLASLYFAVSILTSISNWLVSVPVGFAILLAYQYSLIYLGLEKYIIISPRTSFLSQNREGIFSLFGYLSLYIFSANIGKLVFNLNAITSKFRVLTKYRHLALCLIGVQIFCWGMVYLPSEYIIPSRRMVNTSYVFWVLAQGLQIISLILLVFIFSMLPRVPLLFQAANILTGLVNISMRTIFASNTVAFLVVISYMFAVSAVAVVLNYNNVRIKL